MQFRFNDTIGIDGDQINVQILAEHHAEEPADFEYPGWPSYVEILEVRRLGRLLEDDCNLHDLMLQSAYDHLESFAPENQF